MGRRMHAGRPRASDGAGRAGRGSVFVDWVGNVQGQPSPVSEHRRETVVLKVAVERKRAPYAQPLHHGEAKRVRQGKGLVTVLGDDGASALFIAWGDADDGISPIDRLKHTRRDLTAAKMVRREQDGPKSSLPLSWHTHTPTNAHGVEATTGDVPTNGDWIHLREASRFGYGQ